MDQNRRGPERPASAYYRSKLGYFSGLLALKGSDFYRTVPTLGGIQHLFLFGRRKGISRCRPSY